MKRAFYFASALAVGLVTLSGSVTMANTCSDLAQFTGQVNVKCFGARGDGVTDDTGAIVASINAVPPKGGTVFFPPGIYLTTGIPITDKKVTLEGSGGSCDWTYYPTPLSCATVIQSVTNAPIVKFTVADRLHGDFAGRFWVGLRNLAIRGNGTANFTAFNNQHCLQIDNRGFEAYDVSLYNCGGHGLYLTDSVASNFYNLRIAFANGDGINNDDTQTAPAQGSANATNVFGGISQNNGRDGIRVVQGGWGTSSFGFVLESNAGYGINLVGTSRSGVRFCRFMSTWDEVNGGGSVHFSLNASDNVVDYLRYSSGEPVYDVVYNRNLVWGSSLSGGSTVLKHKFQRILTGGGISSADYDSLRIRDRGDSGDGLVLARQFSASLGLPDSDIYPSSGLPVNGAFNVPNGRGLVSRKADRSGDYNVITSNSANGVHIADGATGPVDVWAPTNIHGNLFVDGSITKTGGGEFVAQNDPSNPHKEIVYASLIGSEVGSYFRGQAHLVNGQAIVDLPEHFSVVTDDHGLTVQLTPRGKWLELYITKATSKQIAVREAGGKSGAFDFIVQGVRKGYEHHRVIQEKRK